MDINSLLVLITRLTWAAHIPDFGTRTHEEQAYAVKDQGV